MNYRILVERSVAEMDMLGGAPLEYQDIAHQTLVENGLVKHLTDGLRSTIEWRIQGDNPARKLASLRFIAQSFQRHLEHLMSLEENDGYMDLVRETAPQLSKKVACLEREHDELRNDLRRIMHRLDQVSATEAAQLEEVGDDLLFYIHRLEDHNDREVGILQEAFERDGGGEG